MKPSLAKSIPIYLIIAILTTACGVKSNRRVLELPAPVDGNPSWATGNLCTMVYMITERIEVTLPSGNPSNYVLYADYRATADGPVTTRSAFYSSASNNFDESKFTAVGNKIKWSFGAYGMESYRIRVVRNGATVASSNDIQVTSNDGCHPDGNLVPLSAP